MIYHGASVYDFVIHLCFASTYISMSFPHVFKHVIYHGDGAADLDFWWIVDLYGLKFVLRSVFIFSSFGVAVQIETVLTETTVRISVR